MTTLHFNVQITGECCIFVSISVLIFSRMTFIASLDAYVTGHYSSMANSFVRRCDPLNRNLQTVRIRCACCNSVLTHGQAGTIPTPTCCFRRNENPGRVIIALLQRTVVRCLRYS